MTQNLEHGLQFPGSIAPPLDLAMSFSVPRSVAGSFYMWTAEEYLEMWLKCSDRGQSTAQLELREGGPIRVDLMDGSDAYGFVEGTFLRILPAQALHMQWTLVAGNVSLNALIIVECTAVRDSTHMTVSVLREGKEKSADALCELLATSLERMTTLLR